MSTVLIPITTTQPAARLYRQLLDIVYLPDRDAEVSQLLDEMESVIKHYRWVYSNIRGIRTSAHRKETITERTGV